MASKKFPQEFLNRLKAIKPKRPRTVIEHILKHGSITTEELKTKYGYNHPPRAARDVRDHGIPIETFKVNGTDGRKIAAYRFGRPEDVRGGALRGMRTFSKAFKSTLIQASGSRCEICLQEYEERYLQIDHRIPYNVAGDVGINSTDVGSYMLICGSCNRAKSWSCEHCENWRKDKSSSTCQSCYWASPRTYAHIAMQEARRIDIMWMGDEAREYENIKARADAEQTRMPEYVKKVLRRHVLANRPENET